jgi:hypothetical protein
VSFEGRPVRCGWCAMNEILDFDHTVLAELVSRRWQADKLHFKLNRKDCGAWLEGEWWRQPANSALKLRWSRRSATPQMHIVFARIALQEPSRGSV